MNGAPVVRPTNDGPRSGILVLRNAVETYFKENAVPAEVAQVGLKYRAFTLNQKKPGGANRVVLIPGEFDGDSAPKPRKYGGLSRENRNAGSAVNPRELLSWDRPITISVWAAPVPGHPQEEGLSIAAAEDLLEQVVRATLYFGGSLHWGEVLINAPPVESAFGAELLVRVHQIGPLYDVTHEIVQAKIVPTGTLE